MTWKGVDGLRVVDGFEQVDDAECKEGNGSAECDCLVLDSPAHIHE